jgi:nucleotidyltransferase/DNA polymerase involved in DNA repair
MMPIFAFLIGMFPQRGLNWLTDKFSIFTQKNNPSVRDLPLMMIEGVTIYDRVRLQELGVDSCYDLANIDYVPYLFKTPYSPRVLINWILQAKLCVYFGEHVKALREHGIHTIWQFYNYKERDLKKLVKSTSLTEDTLILVKSLISDDKDIERLVAAQKKLSQYWNKEEDDTDNEEASDSKRDKDD